jgi:CheY-like chemotaxis protein
MVSNRQLTILHVEDDEMDAMWLRRSLQQAKVANTIITAGHGEEALEILRDTHPTKSIEEPFIMVVDINMPRMHGLELLREIRADEALKDIVVFILSSSDHELDVKDALELGVAGYLVKHDAGKEFLKAATLLDQYWNLAKLPNAGNA